MCEAGDEKLSIIGPRRQAVHQVTVSSRPQDDAWAAISFLLGILRKVSWDFSEHRQMCCSQIWVSVSRGPFGIYPSRPNLVPRIRMIWQRLSLFVILRILSYVAVVDFVVSTGILFFFGIPGPSKNPGSSRHSFVETADDASRWVFNLKRESVLWIQAFNCSLFERSNFTSARKQLNETVKQRGSLNAWQAVTGLE